MAIGLAAAAAILAWIVGELTLDLVKPTSKAASDPYAFQALNAQLAQASAINGSFAFGSLGGLLGLAMGLVGGMSRNSSSNAVRGGAVGLLVGILAGVLPATVLMPLQWHTRNDDAAMTSLLLPTLFHLGLWAGIGLAAGLAFGIGRFGWKPTEFAEPAIAGLMGACVGTVVFEVAAALLFPFAYTSHPISATLETRLFARVVLSGFVVLAIVRTLGSSREKPPTPAREV